MKIESFLTVIHKQEEESFLKPARTDEATFILFFYFFYFPLTSDLPCKNNNQLGRATRERERDFVSRDIYIVHYKTYILLINKIIKVLQKYAQNMYKTVI